MADLSKEFYVRSILSVISYRPGSDKEDEPETTIPLFGPVLVGVKPTYVFRSNISGERIIIYNVFTFEDKKWSEEEYNAFSIVMDVLSFHMERFLLSNVVKKSAMTQYLTGLPNSGGFIAFVSDKFAGGDIMKYDSFFFNLKSFGLISRRYGVSEGDEIMKRYARSLREFAEDDEIIAHFGGDNYTALIKKDRTKKFLKYIASIPVYGIKNGKRDEFNISAVAGVYANPGSVQQPVM